MYRLLTSVYAMLAGLSTLERQKSSNAHILTLKLHGFDFNSILNCLQSSLRALNHSSVLKINGQNQAV